MIPQTMIEGKISVEQLIYQINYYDKPTARSFIKQMPFTVTLEDYAGMEKIFYPQQALSKAKAPDGAQPRMGDLMYYAPWGDVALFYKDFRFANGLIPLGKVEDIDGLMDALKLASFQATFEINQIQ